MAALPIHLRAKRGRQTVFLVADPSDTVRLLKARLAEVNRVAAERIRIYAADEVSSRCRCSGVVLAAPHPLVCAAWLRHGAENGVRG